MFEVYRPPTLHPEPELASERKTQQPSEIHLQQDKSERDKPFLATTFKKAKAKLKARRASMTAEESYKAWIDLSGFSLKTPYSRELYNKPRDFRLAQRLRATELIRMVFGYQLTARLKKEMESKVPNRLRRSNMRDVRLSCIDTDKIKRVAQRRDKIESFHLGVAILDTKDLRDVIRNGFKLDNPSDLIRTYQFAVQDSVSKVDHFCFGDTEAISVEDLRRRFVEWQEGKDVIGVAYSAHSDMAVLKKFNIFMSAIFWIDLALAQYITFQETTAPSLAVVMNRLRIRYKAKLHEPENDAHFAMRTLLGLAVLDFWREWTYWEDGLGAIPCWQDLMIANNGEDDGVGYVGYDCT
ncbi:hypothetical protein F52700_5659 [Fusarium sp. NRRL 52700]|nr:hypothetical protein F52700_5659 [Fusarium sp. NRRL 52700]